MSMGKQFSVFLVNKPGVLAQVCDTLAKEKVNIKALTLVDSQEHGVLRLVLEDGEHAREVINSLNIPVNETEVLCIEMSNKPGAMADICNRLGSEHININYAYCTAGAKGGKTLGVFKVADTKKAQKVLQQRKAVRKDKRQTVKKKPSGG